MQNLDVFIYFVDYKEVQIMNAVQVTFPCSYNEQIFIANCYMASENLKYSAPVV